MSVCQLDGWFVSKIIQKILTNCHDIFHPAKGRKVWAIQARITVIS